MFAATDAFAQLSAGAGYINATEKSIHKTDNKTDTYTTGLNGFYVGAQYDMPVPAVNGLGLNAGVYANFLFANEHSDGVTISFLNINNAGAGTSKYSDISLNIPINATYGFDISRDTKVFAYAGPIFQLGLSNTNKWVPDSGNNSSETDNFAGNNPNRNRFNLLIGGGIGAQVAGIRIVLGVDQSLLNYLTADNYTGSRFQLKLGVGYAF